MSPNHEPCFIAGWSVRGDNFLVKHNNQQSADMISGTPYNMQYGRRVPLTILSFTPGITKVVYRANKSKTKGTVCLCCTAGLHHWLYCTALLHAADLQGPTPHKQGKHKGSGVYLPLGWQQLPGRFIHGGFAG